MNLLLAMVLAQPVTLNLNQNPIMSRQNGGQLSTTRQYAIDCYGGTACSVDGGVLRIWTADAGAASSSGPPIDGGFVLWGGSVGSTNERTLSAGNYTVIDNATASQTQVDWQHGLTCAANERLTTSGTTAMTCSAPPAAPTDISGEGYWVKTASGNLSNEVAMGALGTGLVNTTTTGIPTIYAGNTCTNQFPRSDNASGAWTCASVSLANDTTGTLAIGKGGTGQTTITTNQVYVGTALDTVAAKTLPSCSNATTSKLLYDNATQTFSCGTDQTGGGGVSPLFVAQGSP